MGANPDIKATWVDSPACDPSSALEWGIATYAGNIYIYIYICTYICIFTYI